jgi:hypothetical protein
MAAAKIAQWTSLIYLSGQLRPQSTGGGRFWGGVPARCDLGRCAFVAGHQIWQACPTHHPLSFTKILGPATSAHLANGGGQDGPISGCFHCSLGRLYAPLHGVGCMVYSNQQHRTQQASHVHHFLQLGLVWALFHGRIPRTCRGYRARHALHTLWLLPSKEWSHTGPAQCVAYTLGQQLLIEGGPLGAYCAVLCASVQRRCGPFHRKRTTPSGVISTLLATMQHHLVGYGSARAAALTCSCLFAVQCSATNEPGYSTCCHACATSLRLPRMQSPRAHSCLRAGAALQQCSALACSESYARAAPSA